MLSAIFLFVITSIISFVGSLQLGPVNLAVIRRSITKNYKDAYILGFFGALPELLYAFLAVQSQLLLTVYDQLVQTLLMISIPVFLGIGIYFLWKQKVEIKNQNVSNKFPPSINGLLLGLLNPMLLPFWILVLQTYASYGFTLDNNAEMIAVILGSAAGAFGLQVTLILAFKNFSSKVLPWLSRNVNPITGVMFILIAVAQAFSYFSKY